MSQATALVPNACLVTLAAKRSSTGVEMVTLESFSTFCDWFGPLQARPFARTLDKVQALLGNEYETAILAREQRCEDVR